MTITRKRCAFCQHEQREELEAAIEQGMASCDDLDSRNNWRSGTAAQHQRNHMGEYTNSSNPKCKLCTDPMRKHYEEALSNGNITTEAISSVLDLSKTAGATTHEAPLGPIGTAICGHHDSEKGSK